MSEYNSEDKSGKDEQTFIQMVTLTIDDFNKNDEFAEVVISNIPKTRAKSVNLKVRSISLEGDENLLPNKDSYIDYNLNDIMTLNIYRKGSSSPTTSSSLTYSKMKPCTTPENLSAIISQALNPAIEEYNNIYSTSHTLKCVY